MELHAPQSLSSSSLISSIAHRLCAGYAMETSGDGSNGVSMTHPHLRAWMETSKERILPVDSGQVLPPVLTAASRFHAPTQFVTHVLRSIADAQDGILSTNLAQVHLKGLWVIHAVWTSTQNHANNAWVIEWHPVVRKNLTESIQFTNSASNQLSCL